MSLVNVTIIYGTIKRGNTYNCVQLLLNNLKLNANVNVTDFFLSKDSPYFYHGCLSSLSTDKNIHFQVNYVHSIIKSLNDSDLIILASPVYACDISTEMKVLLDDLSHKFIQNKTNSLLCNKIGLVISTSAGAGLFHTTITLKRALHFLGVNNTFRFAETLYEINWENITLRKRMQINKEISKLSNKILALHISLNTGNSDFSNKITSSKTHPILVNNKCSILDLSYRKKHPSFHNKNTY